jgi:hypothetical protein
VILRWSYVVTSALLATFCVWNLLVVGTAREVTLFIVLAGLFASTALVLASGSRVGFVLSVLSGGLLLLYGLAVVLMGWEDVGGARNAVPLAVGTGLAGMLGIVVGVRGEPKHGQAA